MTTMNSVNEHESSRAGQISSPPAPDSGYTEHHNNGQGENGYSIDGNDSQHISSSQTAYSQGSGSGHSSSTGSKPEDERKLFVGGLTWDTTQEDLREYFSNFGTVLDCSIKLDPSTGRSRGFAFLIFDAKDIVEKILSQNDHFVKGRRVDPKPAHRRLNTTNNHANHNMSSQSSLYGLGHSSSTPYGNMAMSSMGANSNPYSNNRKVFIGGLDPNFPDSQLKEYFSKFGKIDEIDLPYDKEKNERRPFCFISFQTEQAAQEVLRLQRHTIGDISVDVKRAKPKTGGGQQQQLQQQMYDPYGQQSVYGNYGAAVPSYGANAYQAADGYAHWNAYTYNQQANPAAYTYGSSGSTGAPSPGASSYSQYSEHQSNSQYTYPSSNPASTNDYYSQYGYAAPQPASVYADPNAYSGAGAGAGASAGGSYDYAYYPPMNAGMGDNGTRQQSDNSSGNQTDYEHDNHHGKAKASIVPSPTYHPYSRS